MPKTVPFTLDAVDWTLILNRGSFPHFINKSLRDIVFQNKINGLINAVAISLYDGNLHRWVPTT